MYIKSGVIINLEEISWKSRLIGYPFRFYMELATIDNKEPYLIHRIRWGSLHF